MNPSSCCAFVLALARVFALAGGDGEAVSFTGPVAENLGQAGRKLVALAEEIPAEKYGWRPTPEVRSVSEVLMHVAVGNFQLPASLGGTRPEGVAVPETVWEMGRQRKDWERDIVDKTAATDLLRRSFDYATEAIPDIDDLDAEVATWGFRASKRDYLLILQSHAHEHLGQMIAYARALGVTPPWSRRSEPVIAESVAEIEGSTARAQIATIDDWGNLLTSLVPADLAAIGVGFGDSLRLDACGGSATALHGEEMFDVRPGEWIAFVAADGHLTVAISYGSAAEALGCQEPAMISVQKLAQ